MKSLMTLCIAIALVAPGCKKKDKDKTKDETAATKPADPKPADTKPADPKPADTKPAANAVPEVELAGTPAENMIAVFRAGVEAIKTANAADSATILTGMLAKYNVADLRAKSAAAKAEKKGATAEQIEDFKALQATYKTRAEALGKENAAAFGPAAQAWAAAWGIK